MTWQAKIQTSTPTTFADVYTYTWDFSSIMEVDPMITVSSALAIVS